MTQNPRNPSGQFRPGISGNPGGAKRGKRGPQTKTIQQRLDKMMLSEAPSMLERAFEIAKTDEAVLAGLLNFLAASQAAHNLATLGLASMPAHGVTQ